MSTTTRTIVTHVCDRCKEEVPAPYEGHTRTAWTDRDVSAYVRISVRYDVDYCTGSIICLPCAAKELRTEADRIDLASTNPNKEAPTP